MSPSFGQEALGNIGPLEPATAPATGEAGLAAANYTGADQNCNRCAHFEGAQCALFQAPVDPTGHCDQFAPGDGQESPEAEGIEAGIEETEEGES